MCKEPLASPTEAPIAPSSEDKSRKGQSPLQLPGNPGSALHNWVLTHNLQKIKSETFSVNFNRTAFLWHQGTPLCPEPALCPALPKPWRNFGITAKETLAFQALGIPAERARPGSFLILETTLGLGVSVY